MGKDSAGIRGVVERVTRRAIAEWRTLWKVVFALVAIADILGCWPVFLEGWMAAVSNSKPGVSASGQNNVFNPQKDDADGTCSTYGAYYEVVGRCLHVLDWMGPVFCLLCIVESVIRAKQAREEMLENAALDNFEKKLSRLYSSARNLPAQAEEEENDTTYDEDDLLARKTLRFWTPVLFTLCAWAVLLPWRTMLVTSCGAEADTALATVWIKRSLQQMAELADHAIDEFTSWAWQLALPFSFWELHKIYQRILTLLRWVRYFRFAGPLLRMLMKVYDQFFVFLRTQKQAWQANAEKAKRIIHRSMLFDDIRKIESLNKIRGLARVPTNHIFRMANEQESAEVGKRIQEKKQQGTKLKRELDSLKEQVRRSSKIYPTSEIYDRVRDLSKEFSHTVGNTLWTANLISPQTRFSVSWRIVVTCALVSELSRICTSYQLYGRVDVSYTTMMMSVLGCAQDKSGNILTATGRLTRKIVRKLVRLPKEQLLSTCTKSSIASHTAANSLIYVSWAFETMIDLVCFVDIYVWFFTGELDPDGAVVPKPFFYRCILPGTLVQVLDHPTVPEVLPNIIYYTLSAAKAVGYSRMVRWVVAVVPAINIFLVDPIKRYYFRPMEHDEWLRYTESLAVFPAVFSGEDIRYTMSMSHPNFSELDGATDYAGGMRRRNSSYLTSASEVSHVRRRVDSLEDEPSVPSGVPFKQRRSSKASLRESHSFLPPTDMGRRTSSSFGLNLDSQHVTWAPRVDSSTFHLGSQTSLLMEDDSMTIQEVLFGEEDGSDQRRRHS